MFLLPELKQNSKTNLMFIPSASFLPNQCYRQLILKLVKAQSSFTNLSAKTSLLVKIQQLIISTGGLSAQKSPMFVFYKLELCRPEKVSGEYCFYQKKISPLELTRKFTPIKTVQEKSAKIKVKLAIVQSPACKSVGVLQVLSCL